MVVVDKTSASRPDELLNAFQDAVSASLLWGAWSFRLNASMRNGSGIGGRPGTIEFGIGYRWRINQSHVLLAVNKKPGAPAISRPTVQTKKIAAKKNAPPVRAAVEETAPLAGAFLDDRQIVGGEDRDPHDPQQITRSAEPLSEAKRSKIGRISGRAWNSSSPSSVSIDFLSCSSLR